MLKKDFHQKKVTKHLEEVSGDISYSITLSLYHSVWFCETDTQEKPKLK